MFIDARTLPNGQVLDTDICIVGGGAAGITLAKELMGSGLKVTLLESGDHGYEERTQSLYAGPNLGFPAWELDRQRIRALGGSTHHWAGNCMPLDPIDFEAREGIPYSGWPIGRADLDPFYPRAQKLVETPVDTNYDTLENLQAIDKEPLKTNPDLLRTHLYAESPPTNFGQVYEDDLAAAVDVSVYLNANVLEIDSNETASEVTAMQVACIDGPRFTVKARRYVLALGGIETPRLLLLSNKVAPAGLGNDNDLVGRFFMDHASIRPSLLVLQAAGSSSTDLYTEAHEVNGGYFRGALAASEKVLRDEQLPNFNFFLFSNSRSPGQSSAITLRRTLGRGNMPDDLSRHLANVLTDLDGVTNEMYRKLSGSDEDLIDRDWLHPWIVCETIPNPESRVKLVEERDDIFGQNRIGLDWRMTAEDLRVFHRATEILAMELGRLGFGRVWSELLEDPSEWPQTGHGKHHCGTLRMSDNPRAGVVDQNCRMHGISNLYVAGSSVFPTHGHATPTLTIVALAIRLADQIRTDAGRGAL